MAKQNKRRGPGRPPKDEGEKYEQVGVRFPPDTVGKLHAISADDHISIAAVIRAAVNRYIEALEKKRRKEYSKEFRRPTTHERDLLDE